MQWNNGLCLLSVHDPNYEDNIWEEMQDILNMEGKELELGELINKFKKP